MTVPMAADNVNTPDFDVPDFDNSTQQQAIQSSSFTPLPPIRRTSTFGFLTEKSNAGEDADSVTPPVGSSENHVQENMNYQNGDGPAPDQGHFVERNAHPSQPPQDLNQPPIQQHPALARGADQVFNGPAPGGGADQPNGVQQYPAPAHTQYQQMPMGRDGPVGPAGPQPPLGQTPSQPNAPPMNNPAHGFMSQMGGNPIQKFPPGGRWVLEESHLSQPLIQAHRTRPNANRTRPAPNSPPQQQPGYFAYDKETEEPSPPLGPGSSQQFSPRPRNNSNSIPPVSAQRFPGLFSPRGPEQSQAPPTHQIGHGPSQNQVHDPVNDEGKGRPDPLSKERGVQVDEVSVSSVTSDEQNGHFKRNSASFFSRPDRRNAGPEDKNGETAPVKKRLSELKGMIMGVGTAKDGARDDQPAKSNSPHSSRPSIQESTQVLPGSQPPQGHPALQGQHGQPGPMTPPTFVGMGRDSTSGPRAAQTHYAQNEENRGRNGGGFLGGLFNKHPPMSPNPRQQLPLDQLSPQFSMQPGQLPPPGRLLGPHLVQAGQPPRPGTPKQQGVQRLVVPSQQSSQDVKGDLTSPTVLSTQIAQAVTMRRPSEITVSTQGQLTPGPRPPMPGQQGSESNIQVSAGQEAASTGSVNQPGAESAEGPSTSNGPAQSSHHLSYQSSQGRPNVGESSTNPKNTPNRKPVGSGFLKQEGVAPLVTAQTKPDDSDTPPPSALDGRRLSSLPSGQQSPTLGALGHVRQSSLPPPNQTSSRLAGDPQFIPRHPTPLQDQQLPSQNDGNPLGRPGPSQLGQGGPSTPSPLSDVDSQQNLQQQYSRILGYSAQRPLPSHMQGQLPMPPGSPGPNQKVMAKIFGISDGKDKSSNLAPTTKDKSTASKLLNAFKRNSKPHGSNQQQPPVRPPPSKQVTPPTVMRPQHPGQPMPQQPGMSRPLVPGPLPQGFYRPIPGQPQGPLQPSQGRGQIALPQMQAGRVQTSPPMMQGGLGQMPQPQVQAGRGEMPPPQTQGPRFQILNNQRRASTQRLEPQYDVVPIPRGYEAVHGYGNAAVMAPSPYNVGRSLSPSAHPLQQYQNMPSQQGLPPQPWDPRMVSPPHSVSPHGQLSIPSQSSQQGPPSRPSQDQLQYGTTIPDDQRTFLDITPTPSPQQSPKEFQIDQQGTPQAPQGQGSREPQAPPQNKPQQTPVTQTPSSSNWGSAPESSPELMHRGSIQAESDLSVSPPNNSDNEQRSQPQHIATAMNTREPQASQLAFSRNAPAPGNRAGPSSAARLISKMSIGDDPSRNKSLSAEIVHDQDRAMSVSPEPPGARASPFHQASNNSLQVNVERANDLKQDADDIYDATPRMNSSESAQHENTKYAGSDIGRSGMNGTAVAGGVAGAAAGIGAGIGTGLAIDAGAIESGTTPSPEPEAENAEQQPQATVVIHTEPEEKILVDQPVELAAVNDDDDGVPVMSATSYPGQEWNPYGAGEFGDWD
ncbi:hypothetical protein F4779DRAFT_577677 [Xylariaceae sp. FL0662B]|nr:hypothetical protein F4779DRAFT_577677 [Xylariaceae sp. FL0662B]